MLDVRFPIAAQSGHKSLCNGEPERAALPHFTGNPNSAVVCLDDALNTRQANTFARHVHLRGVFPAAKNVKHLRQVLRIDPDPRIPYVEFNSIFIEPMTDLDLPALPLAHVLDGI